MTCQRLFLGVALGCSTLLATQAFAETKSFDIVDPPACQNNKGETVEFIDRQGGRLEVAAGMANRNGEGKPFVMRFNFSKSPPQFQTFIDYHECAHHQLGDVDRPHPPRNSQAHLLNESISDCVAIIRMRSEDGADKDKMEEVAAAMRGDMAKIGFPEISISSRISNLKNCYFREGNTEDYIAEVNRRRAS